MAGRPPLSLDLLPEDRMPAEVRPLIDEINRLLRRGARRPAVEVEVAAVEGNDEPRGNRGVAGRRARGFADGAGHAPILVVRRRRA